MKTSPIKRHVALQPVSRDHHHGLMLCWKIRSGFKKGIDVNRIRNYVQFFFSKYLLPHFEIEENLIFPVLGNGHELVKKAMAEHRRLARLAFPENEISKSLHLFEEELEQHIRFEERVLFNEVQNMATKEELLLIEKHHAPEALPVAEEWADRFWEEKKNDLPD